MTYDDAMLSYHARHVAVRRDRFYRLFRADDPGWLDALRAYHEAEDRYLAHLRGLPLLIHGV